MRLPLAAPATALLLYLNSARAGSAEQVKQLQARDDALLVMRAASAITPSPLYSVLAVPTAAPLSLAVPGITSDDLSHNFAAKAKSSCTSMSGAASAPAAVNGPASAAPAPVTTPAAAPSPAPAATTPAAAGGASPAAGSANIPTAITGTPIPTGTLSPAAYAQNLANAIALNAVYLKQITGSSGCTVDQVACYQGQFGICTPLGLYNFTQCDSGKGCYAMPMSTVVGVSVGCVNITLAAKVLGFTPPSSSPAPAASGKPGAGAPGGNNTATAASVSKGPLVMVTATANGGQIIATLPASGGMFSFTTVWSQSHLAMQTALAVIPIH